MVLTSWFHEHAIFTLTINENMQVAFNVDFVCVVIQYDGWRDIDTLTNYVYSQIQHFGPIPTGALIWMNACLL